ncbi:hypothetical protein [Bordetella genomosp. 13]|uniref:hypothetical protein n=1 Tax=Bordetella genomosp. 13 TaxID=463040 RepID=UPI00119FFFAC|nr:hypothetical protein [Bordetella genomosp. 13]
MPRSLVILLARNVASRHVCFLKPRLAAGLIGLACASHGALAATANDPLLQTFQDRLTNIKAWAGKDDRSPLDLRVAAAPGNAGTSAARTLDGKLQLAVSDATVRVAVPVLHVSLPLVVYRGDVSSMRAWRAQNPGVDINERAIKIAKDAGVACSWDYQSAGTVQRTCNLQMADLLGSLVTALRLRPCAKGEEAACIDIMEQKWAVEPAIGQMDAQQRRTRLNLSLETLLEQVLHDKIEVVDRNGKPLADYKIALAPSGGIDREPLVLEAVQRGTADAKRVLGQVPLSQIFGAALYVDARTQIDARSRVREAEVARQSRDKAVESLRKRPQDLGAIALASSKSGKACTIGAAQQAGSRAEADPGRLGVPMSQAYRTWRPTGSEGYAEVLDSAATLYTALQRQQCAVAIGSGAELAVLVMALQRDGLAFSVMPGMLTLQEGTDLYAREQGYANAADLQLAKDMGNLTPADLNRYRSAGIASKEVYEDIAQRKRASGHLRSHGDLIDFLNDEKAAKSANITVLEAYSRRVTVERAQEQAEQRARYAARPYRITLTCRVGNLVTILPVCLSLRGVNAPLALRDGSESRLYESGDIYRVGRDTPEGFVFDTSPSVALQVRNVSDEATLRLKVIDLRTGQTIHDETAIPFRSVTFSR